MNTEDRKKMELTENKLPKLVEIAREITRDGSTFNKKKYAMELVEKISQLDTSNYNNTYCLPNSVEELLR